MKKSHPSASHPAPPLYSAAGSDLAAPLVTSEADVDVSLSPPSSSNYGASETVDLASSDLNGTWEQDRMVDVDKYLTHSNVPWLVKKMILKIKPKMIIELSATGFKFTMSGGPKSKVEEGQVRRSYIHTYIFLAAAVKFYNHGYSFFHSSNLFISPWDFKTNTKVFCTILSTFTYSNSSLRASYQVECYIFEH